MKINNEHEYLFALGKENSLQNDLMLLHKKIIESFGSAKKITLKGEEKITGDIAFVQLLISFLKYADQQDVNLVFDFEFTDDCKTLLEHSGLLEIIKK